MSPRLVFAALLIPMTVGVAAQRPARSSPRPRPHPRPRSTIRRSSPSRSTTPTSRSSATCAISSSRAARSDLHFMDIAATVNPATVHFRSLTEPSRVSVLEQNYEYDLLEPDKLLRKYVGRDVTLVRTREDGSTTREEEVKARLLSYNNAPVWQIGGEIVTGMHADHIQLSRAARQPVFAADADLDARQHRRRAASRRSVVPRRQAVVERRLRADRRARRQDGRHRRLGDGHQRQRHVVQERAAAARGRRPQSRAPADRHDGGWTRLPGARRSRRRRRCRRSRSPTTTSTRSAERRRSTTARPSRSACSARPAFPVQKRYVVDGQAFYYRNAQHPGAPIKDVVQVFYQFKNEENGGPRHADAGGHGARLPGRLEGRRAVRRRGPHRPHAEGRRRSISRSATPSTSSASASRPTSRRSRATSTRSSSRSRCATTRRRR